MQRARSQGSNPWQTQVTGKRSQGYHGGTNIAMVGRKADRASIAIEGVSPRGSLDHLVRQHQEMRGNGEPKGLGGLEVDDELELRGLLHWQVARLGAFEDFVHIV